MARPRCFACCRSIRPRWSPSAMSIARCWPGPPTDRHAAGQQKAAQDLYRLPRNARQRKTGHRPYRHARPLAHAAGDRGDEGRRRSVSRKADLHGYRRGPVPGCGRQKVQSRRAGQHAAAQHAAPDRGQRKDHPRRQARQGGAGRDVLLLSHAGPRRSSRHAAPGRFRLRDVDGPGPDAAVQRSGPPARLARVHGIRQRYPRRHVRAHVRHGPFPAGPGLAQTHQLGRRQFLQRRKHRQHPRHADGHLRVRRPDADLEAPRLGFGSG